MRVSIVHPGAGELKYEIRGIVEFAKKLEKTGLPIVWENIGDPVAKGEEVPLWVREMVSKETLDSSESYGYSATKGVDETREYLSAIRTKEVGQELKPENIIFFNGLGDAITKTYTWLNPIARVLGPSPAYPTHSSVEGAHGRSRHLTYDLDSDNGWLPDMEDIRNKVTYNPQIAALLIINPDNPTGAVYPKEILEEFVSIALEFDLFLIADEIYANLAFEKEAFCSLAELSNGIPTIVMRGLSKEVPWPGSRCGWLEFYNIDADPDFRAYVKSIEEAKMTEVCSTTLPQTVLPKILGDSRYPDHLERRRKLYAERAETVQKILGNCAALRVVKPKGAFYQTVAFSEDFVKQPFVLPAANPEAQHLLDTELAAIEPGNFDKRFCYMLLAATGICTVPLTSGFNSHIPGFRITLLENNPQIFEKTLNSIVSVVTR